MNDPYTLHVISNDPFRDYPEPQDEEEIEMNEGPALDAVVKAYVSDLQSTTEQNDRDRGVKTLQLCKGDMDECSKRLGVLVGEPGGLQLNVGVDEDEDDFE